MSNIIPSKGWQDGVLIIIPHYCAILETPDNYIPICIFIKTVRAFNCPYQLSLGKDLKDALYQYNGRLKVRFLLHNNDLIIINGNKDVQ
jgi:hypothetical protein